MKAKRPANNYSAPVGWLSVGLRKTLFLILLSILILVPTLVSAAPAVDTSESMKLVTFTIVGAITLILIVGGFLLDSHFLALMGVVFMFVLGIIVLNGGLQIPVGENITTSGNVTQVVDVYEQWDTGNSQLLGWAIAVIAAIMFGFILMSLGGGET